MEFLLIVLVVSVAGIAVVMFRNRRPTGTQASIEEFERSLQAIAPPPEPPRRTRPEDRGPGPA